MPISTCTVSGNVKNLLGEAVQNCTVKASILSPFFHTSTFISGELASTVTDSSGAWSMALIETESVGQKVKFEFEYNDGTSQIKRKAWSVVVPDDSEVDLADLITAQTVPVSVTSFPASSITVVPTGNLASDDVQDALAELQSDIDTINTLASGSIYIGNGSNVATETALSGDVTMTNGGVTSITAGSIVNADVNSSAAIAYSKLNLATSIVNADVSGSAAIAYSKLNLATSIVNADVAAAAAIARSKIAAGTAYGAVVNDSSGALTSVAPGTANNVLKSDGTQWTSGAITVGNSSYTLKTTNYTATSADDVIVYDMFTAGQNRTLTLPAAASNVGKVYTIARFEDSASTAHDLTIDGNGSEEIGTETTYTLDVHGESVRIISDGTRWIILNKHVPAIVASLAITNGATGSIANSTETVLKGTEIIDSAGVSLDLGDGEYTIPKTGMYAMSLEYTLTSGSNAAGSQVSAAKYVDTGGGAASQDTILSFCPATYTERITVNGDFPIRKHTKGDVISFKAFQATGGARTISAGHWTIQYVGDNDNST